MAYNHGYNEDALPAHAEPEQAAQILSSHQQPQQPPQPQQAQYPPPQRNSHPPLPLRPYSYSNPQPQQYNHPPPTQQYQNKPQPPLPPSAQQQQQYSHSPPPPRLSPHNASSYSNSYNNASYGFNNNSSSFPPNQVSQQGPPPPQGPGGPPQGRPPPTSRPPPTPAPPSANSCADASLFPLFKAVDKNGTGMLTEKELGRALVNGDFSAFDPHTVKMMIRMFDVDKNGTINFDEFCGLWGFLAAWRALFDRFDADGSGNISFDEFTNALVAFGYRLSPGFVHMLYTTYDKSGEGRMSFDLFVQSCIILKRMTDVFKKYDEDRDGYITLSFEQFLTEVLRQR